MSQEKTSILEFVEARREILQRMLADPEADIERTQRVHYQREMRLLDRVRKEVPDDKVLETLQSWRKYLGERLADHKRQTRVEQQAVDKWYRLSKEEKRTTKRPKSPPLGIRLKAADGEHYVIDDRYLAMMDDLIARMQKW